MLFHEIAGPAPGSDGPVALAISQPSHAWISGQLLRAWADPVSPAVLLAAEQHDVGWLDWETEPSFDPETGRPHLFRAIGARVHAPMWARGVERALGAWGSRVALLVSRHGGLIYTRYTDRHRVAPEDAAAADWFLETQRPMQAAWACALGLDAAEVDRDAALVAASDTLSLALCGELRTPVEVPAPDASGTMRTLHLAAADDTATRFTLSPWPFVGGSLEVCCEARPIPAPGRFADEDAMRHWLRSPERAVFRVKLTPG
ncbi:DUF3891 family protein [Roseomonas sp. BN140053]|uniref:DUF3891 family protein n=1 Tax=Roseomonas sp. BN140053 TaxID=3391898 RepID=UPI0039EA256C